MLIINEHVAVAGDWHGNASYAHAALQWAHRCGVRTVLHAGDLWYYGDRPLAWLEPLLRNLDMRLYWIDGNHEDHDLLAELDHDQDGLGHVSERVAHLARGTLFQVRGERWVAIGGASSIDRAWRTAGIDWWPGELITRQNVEAVCAHGQVDVVLSHEAPASVPIPLFGDWPHTDVAIGWEQRELLQQVMDRTRPKRWFHGHHHVFLEQQVDQTRVTSLGRDGQPITQNMVVLDPVTLS